MFKEVQKFNFFLKNEANYPSKKKLREKSSIFSCFIFPQQNKN